MSSSQPAMLMAGVPVLNALTTATHLGTTLSLGLWAVAGFDLVCLAMDRHYRRSVSG